MDNNFTNTIDTNTKCNKYVVIMAGGSGTRMNTNIPKQLMKVGNDPMMVHLIKNSAALGYNIVLVVSDKNKEIIIQTLLDSRSIIPNDSNQSNQSNELNEINKYNLSNILANLHK